MSDKRLSARLQDYFERQIACYEALLADLAEIGDSLSDDEIERLSTQQTAHLRDSNDLADEFWALMAEWNASPDTTEADRASLRPLARKAEALAEEVANENSRAEKLAGDKLTALKGSRDALARGRDMLGKYRAGDGGTSDFLDTRA